MSRFRAALLPSLLSVFAVASIASAAAPPPDFNGDGRADLAIGAPGESLGINVNSGAVHVLYGTPDGLTASGSQYLYESNIGGTSQSNDRFGTSLAWGDFDNDGFSDLLIGAEQKTIRGINACGIVYVLYGSPTGLSATGRQYFWQDTGGVAGRAGATDHFGSSLAVGDLNGDGFDDAAVGVRGESVATFSRAGAVAVFHGSANGLTVSGNQLWTQASPGVAATPGANAEFGTTLCVGDFDGNGQDDLAIGIPNQHLGGQTAAGAVSVLYGSPAGLTSNGSQFLRNGTNGIPGKVQQGTSLGRGLAAGDLNGDGKDELCIGAPGANIAGITSCGIVYLLKGSDTGLSDIGSQYWWQNSPGVGEIAETNDLFGYTLAIGDVNGDAHNDLIVSAPYEDLELVAGTAENGGVVHVLYGTASGISANGNQVWSQNSAGIATTASSFEYFGLALAVGDYNGDGSVDVSIGAPGDRIGGVASGSAQTLYGSPSGVTANGAHFWSQDTPGIYDVAEADDNFGMAL